MFIVSHYLFDNIQPLYLLRKDSHIHIIVMRLQKYVICSLHHSQYF